VPLFWLHVSFILHVIFASTVDILAAYFAAVHGRVDFSTYCAVILALVFHTLHVSHFGGIYGTVPLYSSVSIVVDL